eukprot:478087-Prymnesium_polylepis.1
MQVAAVRFLHHHRRVIAPLRFLGGTRARAADARLPSARKGGPRVNGVSEPAAATPTPCPIRHPPRSHGARAHAPASWPLPAP